jgi:hypothetical protein
MSKQPLLGFCPDVIPVVAYRALILANKVP